MKACLISFLAFSALSLLPFASYAGCSIKVCSGQHIVDGRLQGGTCKEKQVPCDKVQKKLQKMQNN